jgi:transposase InsO family protein
MDLIVKLPTTADGHDTILMFVDSRLKAEQDGAFGAHYRVLNARSFAALFVNNVVRLHGLPATLISDRGPQFNDNFWAHTCEFLGIDKRMSSAFHRQTDGQTERTNRTLEEMLRAYVSLEHDGWMLSWRVLSLQLTTPGRKP